jgi:hypothetical protein
MTRQHCVHGSCARPAMRHEVVAAKLGTRGITGLCPLHTVRAVVKATTQGGERVRTNNDPAPLSEWVAAVRSSATMTVGKLTVHDVTLAELAEVTELTPKTLAELAAGAKTYVHATTCAKLTPWVLTVDPSPRGQALTIGRKYGPTELTYAPLGTAVVDSRGRAWQLRGKAEAPRWCPAHLKRTDTPPSLAKGPAWPVRVVYTPAHVYTRITF